MTEPSRPRLEDVAQLSRKLMHQYYAGDYEEWFSRLAPECIWVGAGEPLLMGAEAIRSHFQQFSKTGPTAIFQEEYHTVSQGPGAAQVVGELIVGPADGAYRVCVLFTLGYRVFKRRTMLVSHHFSYEYETPAEGGGGRLSMDMMTRKFVRGLLLERDRGIQRVPLQCSRQTVYVDPVTILYIQPGKGKHSEVVCVDRSVVCTAGLAQLMEVLPPEFYPLHRCYIVNTRYVTSVRRYEAELLDGIKLPIPAATYMQVKRDLAERLTGR
jgi:hypothetical protein